MLRPSEVDLHIHTRYCPCAKEEMRVEAVVKTALKRGLKVIGFVPHSYPIAEHGPGKLGIYEMVREEVRKSEPGPTVFVGAEVDCIDSSGKLLAGREIARKVDYILAAPDHYHLSFVKGPPEEKRAFLDYHHRTIMNLLDDPLVSAIAHPYSSLLDVLPDLWEVAEEYFLEEAQKAKEKGKAMEVNGSLFLTKGHPEDSLRAYERLMGILAGQGTMLLLGSDAHSLDSVGKVPSFIFEKLGIPESQIWLPKNLS
ncbi:MAG: hypothetical protein DRQ08_09835 [Candidatus Latescibacterota bacterium]|nr:MAG: hypothetical protein DRQ08_09835 [Candidatus Latescibacterota bacterium]